MSGNPLLCSLGGSRAAVPAVPSPGLLLLPAESWEASERRPWGLLSSAVVGSPPSLYLEDASNGEGEAGGPGDQQELGEAQTKGENPAQQEAAEHPQQQPRVLETEEFLRRGQMETWKQRERRGGLGLGLPWPASQQTEPAF